MSIFVSLLTAGTNDHEETAENANAIATDFVSEGVVDSSGITNTSGVAPSTGAFAVNAQDTPDMTVKVGSGVAYVQGTPTSGNSQTLRVRMTADTNVTISSNSSGVTKYNWLYIKLDADKLANPGLNADDVATLVTSVSSSSSSDDGTPPTYGYCLAVVTVANSAVSIENASIADKRSLSTSVQDDSVGEDQLKNRSVTTDKLADGAVSECLGYAEIDSNSTGVSSETDVTGLSVTVNVPAGGGRVKISVNAPGLAGTSGARAVIRIKEGTTVLSLKYAQITANNEGKEAYAVFTPSAGSHTYKVSLQRDSGSGTVNMVADATYPAFILVEYFPN